MIASRRTFIAATPVVAIASQAAPAAAAFDRAAFQQRVRAPFPHRQAFATAKVADGAVLAYMTNSLNAYQDGFAAGDLHAAAVMYGLGVAIALDDATWKTLELAHKLRNMGDHVSSSATEINPFAHEPPTRTIATLQRRNASFFVCNNALNEFAKRFDVPVTNLYAHVLPGIMIVPAGVAALNALQEEHFTMFQASM